MLAKVSNIFLTMTELRKKKRLKCMAGQAGQLPHHRATALRNSVFMPWLRTDAICIAGQSKSDWNTNSSTLLNKLVDFVEQTRRLCSAIQRALFSDAIFVSRKFNLLYPKFDVLQIGSSICCTQNLMFCKVTAPQAALRPPLLPRGGSAHLSSLLLSTIS